MTHSARRRVGRYELLEVVGHSPSSVRYLAQPGREREPVVVEIVHSQFVQQGRYGTFALAEAPSAVAFRHPSALRVREVDQGGNIGLIASTRPRGPDLVSVLERAEGKTRSLPVRLVLHVGLGVASVLRALEHTPWRQGATMGMQHGSLSSECVFVDVSGSVRVGDIGLARARLTLPGTPRALSVRPPELFDGPEALTASADVYALGMLMYDLLFGRSIYLRDDPAELRQAVRRGIRPRLARVRADVDAHLEALVEWMLAADPSERPQTVDGVIGMLNDAHRRISDDSSSAAQAGAWVAQLFPTGAAWPQGPTVMPTEGSKAPGQAEPPAQIVEADGEGPPDAEAPAEVVEIDEELIVEAEELPSPLEVEVKEVACLGLWEAVAPLSQEATREDDVSWPPALTASPRVSWMLGVGGEDDPPDTTPLLAPAPTPSSFEVVADFAEAAPDLVPALAASPLPESPAPPEIEIPIEPVDEAGPDAFYQPFSIGDVLGPPGEGREASSEPRYERLFPFGNGEIQLGRERKTGRTVLLELLPPHDPVVLEERLKALGELSEHPNLLKPYEVRPDPSSGLVDAVSRFTDGESLEERVSRQGPLELNEVRCLLEQLIEGVAHLHAGGVPHGGLHPASILVRASGANIRCTVGGLLRVVGGVHLANSGFLAPEQASGRPESMPGDVWSIGAVAYYALTGGPPGDRSGPTAPKVRQVSERRPAARPFDAFFAQALVEDPGERPPHAGSLLWAMRRPGVRR